MWTEWYTNGTEKSKGNYKDDFPVGKWTWWYDNGTKEAEGTFKGGDKGRSYVYFHRDPKWDAGESREWTLRPNQIHPLFFYKYHFPGIWIKGIADGKWTFWHTNGQKWAEGSYKEGNGVGSWVWWWPSGNKAAEGSFIDVKSDVYITDFGLSYNLSLFSGDEWQTTLLTVGGVAYGQWTFWQNYMPITEKKASKWFELTITEGYNVKNEELWDYQGKRSWEGFVDVRCETSSQQLEQ